MRIKFDEQMRKLNTMLIEMGILCEEAIFYAVKALKENSDEMRQLTFETEVVINDRERELEALCMKLLLQQQPVARDLRLISAALKMISDMERIGDQAYDIAEITKTIPKEGRDVCRDHIDIMTENAVQMVIKSVDSYVQKDISLAEEVIAQDDVVDETFELIKDDLIGAVITEGCKGQFFVDILMIAKYLERISDHAVNIAEWVIFSVTGEHCSRSIL